MRGMKNVLGGVVHMLDGSWRECLQSQGVVDSNGDPTGHTWVLTDDITYLSLKGKMASLMLCHFHPIHPLSRKIEQETQTVIPEQPE